MQTALIFTSRATQRVIGVAMVAAVSLPGVRPAWVKSKHPR